MQKPLGKYLVYIEDDIDDIEFFQDCFGHLDHLEIVIFKDGNLLFEFLETAGPHFPCVIVSDINMPFIDGWEIARLLKADARYASIPFVIFSTSTMLVEKQRGIMSDIEVITKPVNAAETKDIAKRLLEYCKE